MSTATHHEHDHPAEPAPIPPTDASGVRRVALIAAVVGLAAYLVVGFINLGVSGTGERGTVRDFFFAWQVGFVFWLAIPFGALGLLMIAYLTQANWGLVLRRCFQAATRTLPVVALLFLPVAVSLFLHDGHGPRSAFWWADPSWDHPPAELDTAERELAAKYEAAGHPKELAAIAADKHTRPEAVEENQHKIHDYLNPLFFLIRAVLYFVIFGVFIHFLNKWARPAEEVDDARAKYNLHAISGPGVIVWALSGTFMVTDWVMSVEPTWASSMFPVVFGMNAFICTMSVGVLTFYSLNADRPGVLGIVKDKFRIDIGTLLFGFTMVWAYASFCQYMLIWAADLPEEIAYYAKRGRTGWEYLAYVLMAFHWLLPFVVFLFREVKTSPRAMRRMAILLLCICAADVAWWIVPAIPRPEGGLHLPMAFAAVVGVGGLWGLAYAAQLGKRPLLPENRETAFLADWGHGH